jgi:hypothetical protein
MSDKQTQSTPPVHTSAEPSSLGSESAGVGNQAQLAPETAAELSAITEGAQLGLEATRQLLRDATAAGESIQDASPSGLEEHGSDVETGAAQLENRLERGRSFLGGIGDASADTAFGDAEGALDDLDSEFADAVTPVLSSFSLDNSDTPPDAPLSDEVRQRIDSLNPIVTVAQGILSLALADQEGVASGIREIFSEMESVEEASEVAYLQSIITGSGLSQEIIARLLDGSGREGTPDLIIDPDEVDIIDSSLNYDEQGNVVPDLVIQPDEVGIIDSSLNYDEQGNISFEPVYPALTEMSGAMDASSPEGEELGNALLAIWAAPLESLNSAQVAAAGAEALVIWDERAGHYDLFQELKVALETGLSEIESAAQGSDERVAALAAHEAASIRVEALRLETVLEAKRLEVGRAFGAVVGLRWYQGDAVGSNDAYIALSRGFVERDIERALGATDVLGPGMLQLAEFAQTPGQIPAWVQQIDTLRANYSQYLFAEQVLAQVANPAVGAADSWDYFGQLISSAPTAWELYTTFTGTNVDAYLERAGSAREASVDDNRDVAAGMFSCIGELAQQTNEAMANADELRVPVELEGDALEQAEFFREAIRASVLSAGTTIERLRQESEGARTALESAEPGGFSSQATVAMGTAFEVEDIFEGIMAAIGALGSLGPNMDHHPIVLDAMSEVEGLQTSFDSSRNLVLMCFSLQRFQGEELVGLQRPDYDGPISSYISEQRGELLPLLEVADSVATWGAAHPEANMYEAGNLAGEIVGLMGSATSRDRLFLFEVLRASGCSSDILRLVDFGIHDATQQAESEDLGLDLDALERIGRAAHQIDDLIGGDEEDAQRIGEILNGFPSAEREQLLAQLSQMGQYDRMINFVESETDSNFATLGARGGTRYEGAGGNAEDIVDFTVGGAAETVIESMSLGTLSMGYGAARSLPILGDLLELGAGDDVREVLQGIGQEMGLDPEEIGRIMATGEFGGQIVGSLGQMAIGGAASAGRGGDLIRGMHLALTGGSFVQNSYQAVTGENMVTGQDLSTVQQVMSGVGVVSTGMQAYLAQTGQHANQMANLTGNSARNFMTGGQRMMDTASRTMQHGGDLVDRIDPTMTAITGFTADGQNLNDPDLAMSGTERWIARYGGLVQSWGSYGIGLIPGDILHGDVHMPSLGMDFDDLEVSFTEYEEFRISRPDLSDDDADVEFVRLAMASTPAVDDGDGIIDLQGILGRSSTDSDGPSVYRSEAEAMEEMGATTTRPVDAQTAANGPDTMDQVRANASAMLDAGQITESDWSMVYSCDDAAQARQLLTNRFDSHASATVEGGDYVTLAAALERDQIIDWGMTERIANAPDDQTRQVLLDGAMDRSARTERFDSYSDALTHFEAEVAANPNLEWGLVEFRHGGRGFGVVRGEARSVPNDPTVARMRMHNHPTSDGTYDGVTAMPSLGDGDLSVGFTESRRSGRPYMQGVLLQTDEGQLTIPLMADASVNTAWFDLQAPDGEYIRAHFEGDEWLIRKGGFSESFTDEMDVYTTVRALWANADEDVPVMP